MENVPLPYIQVIWRTILRVTRKREIYCDIHKLQPLVCPICEGARGGKRTARKHPGKARKWGKLGGRPKRRGRD